MAARKPPVWIDKERPSRRTPPAWVAPFLAALGRTGNVRLAAVEAGVDYTSAYQRRLRHSDFAEAWARVLAEREAAGAPDCPSPRSPEASRPSPAMGGGYELHPRGDRLVRAGAGRWSKRAGEAFLVALTETANVRKAAAAAGFSTTALYKRRMKDRHFAAAWDAAIETGKVRVQAALVEAASRTFDPDELPIGEGEPVIPKVTVSEAINIAKLKAPLSSLGAGPGKGGGSWLNDEGGFWTSDEDYLGARERIAERLERLAKRNDEEKAAAGWTRCEVHDAPASADCSPDSRESVWVPPGFVPLAKVVLSPKLGEETRDCPHCGHAIGLTFEAPSA